MDKVQLYQKVQLLIESSLRPLSIADIVTALRLTAHGESPDTVRKRLSRLLQTLERNGVVRTVHRDGSRPGVATQWKAMNPHPREAARPDTSTTVGVELLEAFLSPAVYQLVADPLRKISATLTDAAERQRLKERVIAIPRHPHLLAPQGNTQVMSQILEAVLARKCFRAIYNSRTQGQETYQEYHGLGLLVRENSVYVVACLDWNPEVRRYALHRFTAYRAVRGKAVVPPNNFQLQRWYLDSTFSGGENRSRLVLKMEKSVAHHLQEMPLARDQVIQDLAGDGAFVRVTATVNLSDEVIWWILGLGIHVEVLEPTDLRREVAKRLRNAAKIYSRRKEK